MKREGWNTDSTRPNSLKPEGLQMNSPKCVQSHLGEITPEKLGFLLSNSPLRAQSCLGEKSLSPSSNRLNMRRNAQP